MFGRVLGGLEVDGALGFWLGLGVSVPLGFAVNLATPLLQKWLARRNARYRAIRDRKSARERELALALSGDGEQLHAFMVVMTATATRRYLQSLAMIILGIFLGLLALLSDHVSIAQQVGMFAGTLVALLVSQQAAVSASRLASRKWRILRLVTDEKKWADWWT